MFGDRSSPEALDRWLSAAGEERSSGILFLERPATAFEQLRDGPSARGPRKRAGREPLRRLLEFQRTSDRPVFLVPQVVVWSPRPEARDPGIVDAVFGPRDFPGAVRAITTFAAHHQDVVIRAGEPLDLREFVPRSARAGEDELLPRGGELPADLEEREARDESAARRISYALFAAPRAGAACHHGADAKVAGARPRGGPAADQRSVLLARAGRMLQRLEARQDANAIAVMEQAFEATIARMYDGFEVDEAGLERLRELSKDGTLVLLPSHNSHIDYILITRSLLTAKMPPPVIAAGDNLDFFPLGAILRTGGAFFIRRKFGSDRLYGAVVDAGRSRTGKLLTPKLGLLSMVVDAALGIEEAAATGGRKVYFCPISLGYERLPEEGAIVRELRGGEKRKESATGLVKSANVVFGSYGRVSVQFGEPLTLEDVADRDGDLPLGARRELPGKRERRALVTRLAHRVMNEIDRVTAVTPGALAATALLTHGGRGIHEGDLLAYTSELAALLLERDARFSPRLLGGGREGAVREAAALFAEAGAVEITAEVPEGRPVERSLVERVLRSGAAPGGDNLLLRPFREWRPGSDSSAKRRRRGGPQGIVTLALLSGERGGSVEKSDLERRARDLSRLFKYEFSFAADTRFAESFERTLAAMDARGELLVGEGRLSAAARGSAGERRLGLYASLFLNFVESYAVAARSLRALRKGPLDQKDLVKRALKMGERLYVDGTISRKEALSKPAIESALQAFESLGYVTRSEGKVRLSEAWESEEGVALIEARVRTYLIAQSAIPRPFVPMARD
ncbi:hypothetical protein OUZ56_032533 [Daphnia magna]|uniref:Phospholipid/glycerol acyltransferase domain-containing protein n=1 Tax=Daphnia magna TaxID=35525 RepID=A0ABR0B961_9CRUS|nr:hypothetical protein OUZ56_032533 [Daphnia magna]